jgi:AraC family L-rhamnose operon transcriptional activator RhaR
MKGVVINMQYETLKAVEFMDTEDEITILKTNTKGHCGLHAHDFIEFAYIDSGKGHHIVGGEKDIIKKGDFFIFNANVPHEYTADEGMPIIIYNCIFQPFSIDNSFKECKDFVDVAYHYLFHSFYSENDPKNYIKLTGTKSRKIKALLEDMYFEYQDKENGYMQILKSDLIKLLILSFRLYKDDSKQVQNMPILKKLVVESTVKYIKNEYTNALTCEKLAGRSYLSPSYFNKIFKEETGKTALQMLQNIRVDEACNLLLNTSLPASQIAINVGYSDTKFFYKLFKQIIGKTPGDYRLCTKKIKVK